MPQLTNFNALAAFDAFGAGRERRDQRTAGQVQNALMSGNMDQARDLAQNSGNAELIGQVRSAFQQMDEQQRAEALRRTQVLGGTAEYGLQNVAAERVDAWVRSEVAPMLAQQGYDISEMLPQGRPVTHDDLGALVAMAQGAAGELTAYLDRNPGTREIGQYDAVIQQRGGQQNVTLNEQGTRALDEQVRSNEADEAIRDRTNDLRGFDISVRQQLGNDRLALDREVRPLQARAQMTSAEAAMTRANRPSQPNLQIGSIPPGYEVFTDPQTGATQMRPIPGGPAEAERQEGERQAGQRQAQNEQFASIATDDIRRAIDILEGNPGAGGRMGAIMRNDPESQSREVERLYSTIGAYIAFDRLQRMREASPTGGALGAVSERELRLLQDAYGALDVSAPAETQIYNLRRLENLILDVVHGPGNRPGAQSQQTPAQNPPQAGSRPGAQPRLRYNPETGQIE